MGQYIKKIGVLNIAIAKYTLVQKHQGRRPGEHEDQALCSDRTSGTFQTAGKQSRTLLPAGFLSTTLGHHGGLFYGRSLVFLFGPRASVLWKEQYRVLYIHRISFTDSSQLYQEVGIISPSIHEEIE